MQFNALFFFTILINKIDKVHVSRKALSDFSIVQEPLSGDFTVPKLYFKRTQLRVYASNTASRFTLLFTT